MKAPDKIYINGFSAFATEPVKDGIEYIRKDYVDEMLKTAEDHAYFAGQEKFREKLTEWLEGRMTKEGATEGIVGGYDMALKDVIEHLKEM